MKRTLSLGLPIIAVLFFTSCQREQSVSVDQNRIYSDYSFTYDAGKNQTNVKATFRLDHSSGKKLELTFPSRVDFNGERMAWRNALGYYELSRTGNIDGGSFVYVNSENASYSNQAPFVGAVEIPFGMNNISKGGNFFLPWDGGPLLAGETIKVTIKGGQQTSSKTFTVSTVGATRIVLDQYKLEDLVVGSAEIQIEREKSISLAESNLSGGRIQASYVGLKIPVNISN